MKTMTYTLVFAGDFLIATVVDGGDIETAVAEESKNAGCELTVTHTEEGCTLTNDKPDDEDRIVWNDTARGWPFDEAGKDYLFAIR